MRSFALVFCICLAGLSPVHIYGADDVAAQAKAVVDKVGAAVVSVEMLFSMSATYGGRTEKSEYKADITGTVIDPSGLTVVALSSTNPGEMLKSLMGSYASEMNIKTDASDVKIRLADGKEIPAKIVLRDRDLDLAFIRPSQKLDSPTPYVDLKQTASPQMLDQVIVVDRLGKIANRVLSVSVKRVQSVIEKPRKSYVVTSLSDMESESASLPAGMPVFTPDGKVVGIQVLRMAPVPSSALSGMGDITNYMLLIVLPAADIAEVAQQVPEDAPKESAGADK